MKKKKKSEPLSGVKGVEIKEGQVQDESDSDSDSSDLPPPHKRLDPEASTSKDVERFNKMEHDLAAMKILISHLLSQSQTPAAPSNETPMDSSIPQDKETFQPSPFTSPQPDASQPSQPSPDMSKAAPPVEQSSHDPSPSLNIVPHRLLDLSKIAAQSVQATFSQSFPSKVTHRRIKKCAVKICSVSSKKKTSTKPPTVDAKKDKANKNKN